LFILGKAFNALALQLRLIYITSEYVVQIWHHIQLKRTGIIETSTWTNIRCRNSSTIWWDQYRTQRLKGLIAGDRKIKNFFLDFFILPFFVHRYLEYFIGLLSGEIKINSLPMYLRFIKMESPPCMHHKISYHENEWSSFIKIFEGEKFVFISGRSRSIIAYRERFTGLWER
jgi:hypothetical protein